VGVKNKINAKLSPSFAGIGAWAELGNINTQESIKFF
jgi:hypothetical protein